MIVSNASPLIHLGRLGRLDLLRSAFGRIIIPRSVFAEVVTEGERVNAADAAAVTQAIADGWIEVRSVRPPSPKRWRGLHRGEREAISLAKELKCPLLIDDSQGRLLAKLEGVEGRGTLYVLLSALRDGRMDLDGYLQLLDGLARSGFRMAESLYIEAVRMGREIAERAGAR